MNIQRFDAHAVAGKYESLFIFNPNRNGKHAAKPRKTCGVPSLKGAQDHLCVTAGVERVSGPFELSPQLLVIINLPIKNQDRVAILSHHGLLPALKINDLQPYGP